MANAPVVSPVLSVSPPPCKDERLSVGMEGVDRLGIEIAAVLFSYTASNEEAPVVFQGRASLGGAATPWPKMKRL